MAPSKTKKPLLCNKSLSIIGIKLFEFFFKVFKLLCVGFFFFFIIRMIVCLAPSPVCRLVIKVKILKFYDLAFACCYLNSNQMIHLVFFFFFYMATCKKNNGYMREQTLSLVAKMARWSSREKDKIRNNFFNEFFYLVY